MPAFLLAALAGSPTLNLLWHSPLFQTFLLSVSAALAALAGFWLESEARLDAHPAVLALAIGFGCQALLLGVTAWMRDPLHLTWMVILSCVWATLVELTGALLIGWRRLRHRLVRSVLTNPLICRLLGAGLFCVVSVVVLVSCRVFLREPAALARVMPWLAVPVVSVVAATLPFTLRLYLKRGTLVILSFAVAQLLFALSVTALMLANPWHLLWWYGHSAGFLALFTAALGIVDGNRTRSREALIVELGALSRKLEEQSVRDPLTGCYNRRFALEMLESEFRKARRAKLPMTLLVADADSFKSINDTHGHPMGDFVLKELVARLRETIRTSDVLARVGGEEFYMVLPLSNRMGGQQLANKLLQAVRSRPFVTGSLSLRVTLSIGIADTLTPGVTDVVSLIEAADRALYSAKAAGKDRAVMMEPLAFSSPQPL